MSTRQHLLVILILTCLLWLGVYGSVSAFAGQTVQAEGTQTEFEAKTLAEAQISYTATLQVSNEFITGNGALTSTTPLSLPQLADLSPQVFEVGETEPALLYVQDKTLFRLDLSQPKVQPLAKIWSSQVDLSPDSRYLAYDDDSGLQVLDTKSGEIVQLLEHVQPTQADPTRIVHFSPAGWSSQNALLVRQSFFEGSILNQWMIMTEKKLRPLNTGTACGQAVWSPDGNQLAVSDYDYGYVTCTGLGLTVVNMVNHTPKRIVEQEITYTLQHSDAILAAALDMSWSPTGEWIAFGLEQAAETLNFPTRLYIVRPDGRDLTPLTNNIAGKVRSPIWASDEIFYFAIDELGPQVDGIYVHDLTSQTQTRLIAGSHLQLLSLSPGGEFLLYQQREGYDKGGAWYAWSTHEQQIIPLIAWSAEEPPVRLAGWLGGEPFQQQWQVETLLVAPGEPGRLYALTRPKKLNEVLVRQLLISDDFGQTWLPFSGGLPVEWDCLHHLNLDYATPDALYASTCRGLYRWSGSEWVLVSEQKTCMVAVVYGQPELMWAIEGKDGCPFGATILRSENGGQTWFSANTGLQGKSISDIAIDPRNANVLYSIAGAKWSSNLHRGTAIGQWSPLPNPEGQLFLQNSMTMDGAGTVYVLGNSDLSLWRSQNPDSLDREKVQWERVHDFGQNVYPELLASGWGPNGLALYANLAEIQSDGFIVNPVLHRSLDGGQTWEPVLVKY